MQRDKFDFLFIGAQKSGTTTLFKLLKQHPKIFLPAEKELPFFTASILYEKGWEWFYSEFFSKAKEDQYLGTITPQYMAYRGTAEKIYAMNPDMKLIAILRDPFERAYSHYEMSVKRGIEKKDFLSAVKQLSDPLQLEQSRDNPDETNSYIVWGEYGRILSEYRKYFRSENLLITFTSDLESRPEEVLAEIFEFLNIEPIVLQGVGQKYHVGSSKLKYPIIARIKKIKILKNVFTKIVPFKQRAYMMYWIDLWNTSNKKSERPNIYVKELEEIYSNDNKCLETVTSKNIPWANKLGK